MEQDLRELRESIARIEADPLTPEHREIVEGMKRLLAKIEEIQKNNACPD